MARRTGEVERQPAGSGAGCGRQAETGVLSFRNNA